MNIIILLLLISLSLVMVIMLLFFWTVKSGQYDDMESPSFQLLQDDDAVNDDDGSGEHVDHDR